MACNLSEPQGTRLANRDVSRVGVCLWHRALACSPLAPPRGKGHDACTSGGDVLARLVCARFRPLPPKWVL